MKLFNLFSPTNAGEADSNYVEDELFLIIKEIQYLFSISNKVITLNENEVKNFNSAILLFFKSIEINDPEHLNYIGQKLHIKEFYDKEKYLLALDNVLEKDDVELTRSVIDFRLRAVKYVYRYYHNSLSPQQKNKIKEGLYPLLKYFNYSE